MADDINTSFSQDVTQSSKLECKIIDVICLNEDFNDSSASCITSPLYTAAAFGKELSVYKEDTKFWKHTFGSSCGYVSLSDDLLFLCIVEKPGKVHLFHISDKLIWSYECKSNEAQLTVQNIMCSSPCATDSVSICIFTNESVLFQTVVPYKEDGSVSESFNDIIVKKFELSSLFPNLSIKSAFETFSHEFLVGLEIESGVNDLSASFYTIEDMVDGDFTLDREWNNDEMKFFLFDISGYGKMNEISCTRNGRYVLCLNQKNTLLVFSAFTQLKLKTYGEEDVQDFTLFETISPSTFEVSDCKIGVLRKNGEDQIFEVLKFPSFGCVHRIPLSESAHLIKSKPNQDSWYITEINQLLYGDSASLNLTSISESSPEARLQSLLTRRKFKEAEKYAKIYNLNEEVIYKVKISCMIQDYSKEMLELSECEQENIWNEVDGTLSKIKDVDFIKSSISSLAPDVDIMIMRKLLSSINRWLKSNHIEGVEDLICEMNQNDKRLHTYFMLSESVQMSISLKEFLKKDLLQSMICELTEGSLSSALIIWQSHKSEILISLSSAEIKEILDVIPDDIPSFLLISFLKEDFLLPILNKVPDAIDVLSKWIISRIYLLELTEKESWPSNGDNLASMFLKLLQEKIEKEATYFSNIVSLAFIQKKVVDSEFPTGQLSGLSKDLKFLLQLKKLFNCKISLTVFQESKLDVISAVLDRINLKYVVQAINELIRPYSLENNTVLDLNLELYIENTLKNSHFNWWSWDEDPWEERLAMVLECILDLGYWVKAALVLVSHAAVPWSERIKGIVEKGSNLDHSSKGQFKEQPKQASLKEILLPYGLKDFPLNKDVERICSLVNYILKQNKASAADDAKKVILAYFDSFPYEAYKMFLQFYLCHNKLDDFVSFLKSMPDETAIECSNSELLHISMFLEDDFLIKHARDQVETYIFAGLYLVEFLKSKKAFVDPDLVDNLKSIQKLRKEFEIYLTLSELSSKENTFKILEAFIQSVLDEEARSEMAIHLAENQVSNSTAIIKIKRLGHILGLEVASVLSILITICLQRKFYSWVVTLCQELIFYNPTWCSETLMEVLNHFFRNLENIGKFKDFDIYETICHLSNIALTYCDVRDIDKYVFAAKLSTYLASLTKITSRQLVLSTSLNTDVYSRWRFSHIYEDGGFTLDVSQVTDFVFKLVPLFLRNSRDLKLAVDIPMNDIFNTVFKPIIFHMKEKGQLIAALRTMYLFYNLQTQFLQNGGNQQEAFSQIENFFKDSVVNLVFRMIDTRKLDMDLSIGLLSMFSDEQTLILQLIKKRSAKDLRCIMSLGQIGSECCRVFENPIWHEYETIYRRALLLIKQNIKVTEPHIVFDSNSEFAWDVAGKIIASPNTNLSTIIEFCSAFGLDTDSILTIFMNNLLSEADKLCITSSDIPEGSLQLILNRAKCAIEAVTNEEMVVNNLENLLKRISPYNWEILKFINEQLVQASAGVLTISSNQFGITFALLNFLRVYQRTSPPGEFELERWMDVHPTERKLPAIANKRLPFSCLSENLSKIINPELTASSLGVWLCIAPVLNISKDHLVIAAVKNAVSNYLNKLPSNNFMLHQDNSFLHRIHGMIKQISDPKSSALCAWWVTRKIPPGTNKMFSSMIAIKFVRKWHESLPNDPEAVDLLKKSNKFYEDAYVEQILYKNNLTTDKCLSYVQNVTHLIVHLIEKFSFSAESTIKVCKVAEEVAKVARINLDEIFKENILNWLTPPQTSSLNESVIYNDAAENGAIEDENDNKNISRVINLLLGLQSVSCSVFDMFKPIFFNMAAVQRARLLLCLTAVYGYAYVAEAIKIPQEKLEESLPSLLCDAELDHLHLRFSHRVIFNVELVQNILSSESRDPKVLLCAVKICIENKIWSSEVWDIILPRLVGLSKIELLQDVIEAAQVHLTHMWRNKYFVSAWNSIISSYQYENELQDSSRVIEKVYKAVLRCPCVSALDVKSLWTDLKVYINSLNGPNLEELEPISDSIAFMQALKRLHENSLK